jgi:hypothetical protein
VVDFGQKPDFGRCHRIVFWQEQFQLKDATFNESAAIFWLRVSQVRTFIWGLGGAVYADVEVSEVIVMWDSTDSWNPIVYSSASRSSTAHGGAYGSAINLSVSFMILFGNAILSQGKGHQRLSFMKGFSYPAGKGKEGREKVQASSFYAAAGFVWSKLSLSGSARTIWHVRLSGAVIASQMMVELGL